MEGKDFEAVLIEIEKKQKGRIKVPVSWETLGELIKDVQNPKPAEADFVTDTPLPVMVPEFPKLKVRYAQTGAAEEWIVVANFAEEAPYHAGGWYTAWPPNAPASIKQTETMESMIEKLKADGVKERPKEEWARRKELAAKR